MHLRELLQEGARALAGPEGRREAVLLLAHVLGVADTWVVAHACDELPAERADAYRKLIARRARGEPVAYILGTRGFHALDLEVTPAVLIPRPETELLVDLALQRIPASSEDRVADLGTGSGAVALAIARARPRARIVATDASMNALEVARTNADRLELGNVEFRHGTWYEPLAGERFGLIASNPPYIPDGDPHLGQGDLRFEPRSALASGADGLDGLRAVIGGAPVHLRESGWLLVEHGFDQGPSVRTLFAAAGFTEVATERDLGGHERATCGRLGGET